MDSAEFAKKTENTNEYRGIQVRQVVNGYAVVGTRTFHNKDTNTAVFSLTIEGVAPTQDGLFKCITDFFTTGSLTGQPVV